MQIIDFLFVSLLASFLKIIRVIILKPEISLPEFTFFSAKEQFQFALLLLILFSISF